MSCPLGLGWQPSDSGQGLEWHCACKREPLLHTSKAASRQRLVLRGATGVTGRDCSCTAVTNLGRTPL